MLKLIDTDPEYNKYEVTLKDGTVLFIEIFGEGGDKDMYEFIEHFPQYFNWDDIQGTPVMISDENLTMDIIKEAVSYCPSCFEISNQNGEEINLNQ